MNYPANKDRKEAITHRGTVTKVEGSRVTVALRLDGSECSGCQIAALCNRPEKLQLTHKGAQPDLLGKQVLLSATSGARRLAQWCFLGVPIALILASLAACHVLGTSQRTAALSSIGAVACWFAVLYLLRRRLDFSARFSIVQIL